MSESDWILPKLQTEIFLKTKLAVFSTAGRNLKPQQKTTKPLF